jgi:hypothetical protein
VVSCISRGTLIVVSCISRGTVIVVSCISRGTVIVRVSTDRGTFIVVCFIYRQRNSYSGELYLQTEEQL